MESLTEISKIITRSRIKKIELLTSTILNNKGYKLSQLYNGIVDGDFKTDQEAAEKLYHAGPSDGRYTRLKTEFKKRLYNNLFYLDVNQSSFSDFHKAKISCHKYMALANLLSVYGARYTAMKLAEKNLKKAQKFSFHDVVLNCARILKDYYALMGNHKKFQHFENIADYHQQALLADLMAENFYQRLIINYSTSVASNSELSKEAKSCLQILYPYTLQFNSFTLQYYYYRIKAIGYEVKNRHKNALTMYNQAEQFLEENPHYKQKSLKGRILLYKLGCYIYLKDFENGEQVANEIKKVFTPKQNNWFIFLENYFLLAIRTGNYQKGKEIFNEAVYHPKFQSFSQERKERWLIFEAYLNFILSTAEIEEDELQQLKTKRFNIYRFMNEVPIFTKDKRGYNIAIQIIFVLFMLKERKYNEIIEQAASLQNYSTRYLKQEEDIRSKLFIKMLLVMDKASFDHGTTIRKTKEHYRKLRRTHYTYKGGMMNTEIVPYEKLWKIVLQLLKSQKS